jgi:hypothetical protein
MLEKPAIGSLAQRRDNGRACRVVGHEGAYSNYVHVRWFDTGAYTTLLPTILKPLAVAPAEGYGSGAHGFEIGCMVSCTNDRRGTLRRLLDVNGDNSLMSAEIEVVIGGRKCKVCASLSRLRPLNPVETLGTLLDAE